MAERSPTIAGKRQASSHIPMTAITGQRASPVNMSDGLAFSMGA
jgi:hypothetical protein